jgi:Ca2+-dependent lipid-binding protein
LDGREVGRTDTAMNTLNPTLNGSFEMQLYDIRYNSLSLEVYDHDSLSEEVFLGNITFGPSALSKIKADDILRKYSKAFKHPSSSKMSELRFQMSIGTVTTLPPVSLILGRHPGPLTRE